MNRRGKNHYGTLACGPDYDEGRPDAASGFLVRAVRPRDARPLAREEGHRRIRAGRRISERVEDRQLLHATEQMAADGTGGDPPRPRTRPRPRLRSRSALAVPAEERLRRRRGGRVADPGGARSDSRPGERVSGERPAVAAGAEDHLPYVKWNVRRGRPPGLLTLRVRYKDRVGDWFDLLLIPPEELARLAHETGWDLERVIWEGGYQPGDYVGVLGRR